MILCAHLILSSTKNVSAYVIELGKFLRLTSLDKLSQLFNVLNGSMTFIGPRPCLKSEFELIGAREKKYFLPGSWDHWIDTNQR